MAITKAEIFADVLEVVKNFGPLVTSIDSELKRTLYDLTIQDILLPASTSFTTTDGTASYAIADEVDERCKYVLDVSIDGGNQLDLMSYREYQSLIEDQSSPTEGEPTKYAIFNNTFYFYYVPDDAYTVNVAYYKYHDNSLSTIEYDENMRSALVSGVMMELWCGQLSSHPRSIEQAAMHTTRYEDAVRKLARLEEYQPLRMRYRDI